METTGQMREGQPPAGDERTGSLPRIVYAFGSACSPWILPMYQALAGSYELVILSEGGGTPARFVVPVASGRSLFGWLPSRWRDIADYFATRAFPTYDRILNLDNYLANADIVHTVELHSAVSCQVARSKPRFHYRHVCTVWENIAQRRSSRPAIARAKKAVIESADHFIAVTERARTALLLEGIPEQRISVVPPGAIREASPVSPPAQRSAGSFRMLFAGKKQRSKGVEELLYALWLLKTDSQCSGVSLTLTFLGVEPSKGPYGHIIRRYGLQGNIVEIPFVPHEQVANYYREADVLVVPSRVTPLWQEQFGMVFAEAMALGVPVVTTHSGSISEVVGDAGLFARPNDHHSLYLCLKELALNPELRRTLGEAGPRQAEQFLVSTVACKLRQVYERTLSAGRTATAGPAGDEHHPDERG